MFSIMTRHSTLRNAATFFKKNTDARKKYEELANDPDLEQKLKHAIDNEMSSEAQHLN